MTTQFQQFLDALAESHQIRTRVCVLDKDETTERDVSDFVLSGQVDLDATTRPDRTLSVTLLDVDYRLAVLDPHSPALGGLWAGSLLRVYYDVFVSSLNAWVTNPVFTGPVTTFARDGAQVTVEAQGKESFLQPPNEYDNVFSTAQVTRVDHTRRAALGALLRAIGEPQPLSWAGTTDKLPKTYDARRDFISGQHSYLYLAAHIVGSGNQFFFDGYGTPTVRLPDHDTGVDLSQYALTVVSPTFDVTQVRNRARAHVTGQQRGTEVVTIADNDPLSPKSLGRSGLNRYLDAGTAEGTYKSMGFGKAAAQRLLRGTGVLDVTFDSLPLPFLQPKEIYQVTDVTGQLVSFSIGSFSLGLGASDSMSVGYRRQILDPRNSHARFIKRRTKHGR